MTSLRKLLLWSIGLWILFVVALIALILIRYYFLGPWLGYGFADVFSLVSLLIMVFFGSRFIVKKLELQADIKLLLPIVAVWAGLSTALDLTLHRFFTTEEWKSIFVSSILVQTDFWIVLILCEIVGPFLVLWLIWGLERDQT